MAKKLENTRDLVDFDGLGGAVGSVGGSTQNTNYNSYIDNIKRMTQQQNQLGPDEFGSYTIPLSDPTYITGQQYARSIAGGIPMSQVIAPGVSYSPEQPGGYTQADLNIAAGITPPPPVYKEPDDPSFFGTGIGGVTIPGGRRDKMPPLRNIFGNMPATVPPVQAPPVQVPPQDFDIGNLDIEQIRQDIADSGIDFTNLFGLPQAPDLSQFVTKDDLPNGRDFSIENLNLPDFSKFALREDLPVYQEPDLSQFVTKQDLPSLIPDVPNGRDFSIDQFDLPDFSKFALREDLPVYQEPNLSDYAKITDLPSFDIKDYRDDFLNIAREGIEIPEYKAPDLSGYAKITDLPTFNPDELKKDIMMSLPTYEQQDLSGFARIEDLPTFNPDQLKKDILMSLPEQQMQDLSGFMTQDDINKAIAGIDIPTYQSPDLSGFAKIEDIPTFNPTGLQKQITALQQRPGFDPTGLQQQIGGLEQQITGMPQFDPSDLQAQIAANQAALAGIDMPTAPDLSQFVTQEDIQRAISGINIPTYQAPDLSPYDTRIAELEQQLASLNQPTGGSFSISQPRPMGLF